MVVPRAAPRPFADGPAERGASSAIVFQAPQSSHRPLHFEWIAPQFEHENEAVFAIPLS
jgi:hypothetical protein